MIKLRLPSNRDAILHNMIDEQFIRGMDNGNYAITNMGALLLEKDLKVFHNLKRKCSTKDDKICSVLGIILVDG